MASLQTASHTGNQSVFHLQGVSPLASQAHAQPGLLPQVLLPLTGFHSHEDPLVSRMDPLPQMLALPLKATRTLAPHSLQCPLQKTLWFPPLRRCGSSPPALRLSPPGSSSLPLSPSPGLCLPLPASSAHCTLGSQGDPLAPLRQPQAEDPVEPWGGEGGQRALGRLQPGSPRAWGPRICQGRWSPAWRLPKPLPAPP